MDSISIMRNVKDASETFLPNDMSGFKEASKSTIGILGSGDFAKSLAIRLIRSGYAVVIGSRNPKRAVGFFPPVVEIVHQEDAVLKTNLIFVAMHREHYTSLWDLKHLLIGKILVDVSNNVRINQYPEANAEYLASLFPNSTVVKGFNVISAWALQFGPKDANRQIYICSNVVEARQQIIELTRQLDFTPVDMGTLASAKEIENMPLHLFTLWKGPVLVAIGLSIFFYIYSFIRDIVHPYVKNKQSDFYKIPIEMVNKTLPVVAITLLSLVYLAGLLASAFQLNSGTKYRRFPAWLEHWLQCRKQLGLLSFFFASVHTIYSLCLPMRRSERYFFLNMAYQQVHINIENSWNEEEVWRMEMYISFGIMSLGLLSLLAVTSIPSVSSSLNWREFNFIHDIRPVDLNRVVNLIEDRFSCNLVDRHLHALKRVVKRYQFGFPIKDLVLVFKILNLCAEKVKDQGAYIKPICEILKLCGLPFLKEKSSDESTFAQVVSESISQMGYLLRICNAEVRLQICDSIMKLYSKDSPRQEIEEYYPTSKSYNMQMIEESGVVETLVMGLTLVENQPKVKLQIIQTLQCLSRSSAVNCNLMLNALAANKICRILNNPDPTGQLLFCSSAVLWNLLEQASEKELINQLSDFDCICALKEVFLNQMINGHSNSERQLRNDLLVITTSLAEHSMIPFIETGFTKLLIMFAAFPEVKSHNPLVQGIKISSNHEDFEMKKIFFNLLVALTNDLASIQLLSDGGALLALFHYVQPNENPGVRDWSPAQYEELQLHALATLISLAPVMVDDYMKCQGNTRLLLLLDWCISQNPYYGKGNSFHATGGHGSKKAQMRYCLRLLRSMASLGEELINQNLHDQGVISQLLDILKIMTNSSEEETKLNLDMQTDILIILSSICENDIHRKELFGAFGVDILIKLLKIDPNKFYSGMGHNKLILATVDCVWCCIVGCYTAEDSFLEMGGIFLLLDLLEASPKRMHSLILGTLLELCDNPKTAYHINVWRGKHDSTAASLLLQLWREEEKQMRVKRDDHGRILDSKKPLIGITQDEYGTITLPSNRLSPAVIDVAENSRVKIYSIFCKLGFEDLPGLSAHDYVTLAIVHRYLDFMKAKNDQERSIELSKVKNKDLSSIIHKTEIAGLHTTGFWGRFMSIESTSKELLGGPFSPPNLKITGTCRDGPTMKDGDTGSKLKHTSCSVSVK
ncbi:cilia- and flagella-associated protein 69 isoform X3 [Chiloscyllium punctatum]|uniref:cilia- and flagella-associated protein 69 isoform X3 n=1 Tax=Chiloscyllium punctatum TaxID=137246 RepID=UPI003B641515